MMKFKTQKIEIYAKLEKGFFKDPLENQYDLVCEYCQTPTLVQF